jgi:hypothetical protein
MIKKKKKKTKKKTNREKLSKPKKKKKTKQNKISRMSISIEDIRNHYVLLNIENRSYDYESIMMPMYTNNNYDYNYSVYVIWILISIVLIVRTLNVFMTIYLLLPYKKKVVKKTFQEVCETTVESDDDKDNLAVEYLLCYNKREIIKDKNDFILNNIYDPEEKHYFTLNGELMSDTTTATTTTNINSDNQDNNSKHQKHVNQLTLYNSRIKVFHGGSDNDNDNDYNDVIMNDKDNKEELKQSHEKKLLLHYLPIRQIILFVFIQIIHQFTLLYTIANFIFRYVYTDQQKIQEIDVVEEGQGQEIYLPSNMNLGEEILFAKSTFLLTIIFFFLRDLITIIFLVYPLVEKKHHILCIYVTGVIDFCFSSISIFILLMFSTLLETTPVVSLPFFYFIIVSWGFSLCLIRTNFHFMGSDDFKDHVRQYVRVYKHALNLKELKHSFIQNKKEGK